MNKITTRRLEESKKNPLKLCRKCEEPQNAIQVVIILVELPQSHKIKVGFVDYWIQRLSKPCIDIAFPRVWITDLLCIRQYRLTI